MDEDRLAPILHIISQEIYIQKLSYVYAFLHIALQTYTTANTWGPAKPQMYSYLESPGSIQYPHLDLSTRASARREKKKYATLFQDAAHERPYHSERFFTASYWIRKNGPF
jgi:hypothetical protein